MTEYRVLGTGRENGGIVGNITRLTVETSYGWKTWSLEKIIRMIKKDDGDEFWSFHYHNGEINDRTRIIVEVVDVPDGRYLRTRRDDTEDNNLLELPIFYYDSNKKIWICC